ncbi:MAG: type 2 isopentenyl-diphosphate Delta-isomerase [Acidimicrobiia bacterium]
MDPSRPIIDRKRRHMEIALSDEAGSVVSAGWEDVHLVPSSVPEVSVADVELATTLLGHQLQAPLVIASMTGGHQAAFEINATLGAAAERLGLAVGAGSQRAALREPSLSPTYAVIRERAPSAVVIANLGMCQLLPQRDVPPLGTEEISEAVAMLDAQVLAIHLNVVEELIQTEGDRNTSGLGPALAKVVGRCPVPILAKETGAGMTLESASLLAEAGVAALDVGGAGGTSFVRIEGTRAREGGDLRGARLGDTFARWGLPTAAAIVEVGQVGLPVIATGGVRTGLDAAKALALGADLVGLGRPALAAAMKGLDPLLDELELLLEELRMAMVLTGSARIPDLRRNPPVLTGFVGEWVRQRRGR